MHELPFPDPVTNRVVDLLRLVAVLSDAKDKYAIRSIKAAMKAVVADIEDMCYPQIHEGPKDRLVVFPGGQA